MILRSLTDYYRRMAEEGGKLAPEGFEKKEIPFLVVLNRKGEFVDLQDTRECVGKKKRGRIFTVPKGEKRTRGIKANLLWDSPGYVFGGPKREPGKNEEKMAVRAREQHRAFLNRLRDAFPDPSVDEGVHAVVSFLKRKDFNALFEHEYWREIEENAPNITFRLEDDAALVCQRPVVAKMIAGDANKAGNSLQMCLVSGEPDEPAQLHTAIKGIRGAKSTGANLVSFNLASVCSFGKKQGFNAPVGKRSEFAYTSALNHLLGADSRRKLLVGDATVVFWGERENRLEDFFAELFCEPAKESPDQLNHAVRALYAASHGGAAPLCEDDTPFFVLGLAPNAARIAVRFWHAETVAETARHIKQHFDDCAVIHGSHQPDHLSLFRLLVSTAASGKVENIRPNLAGDFMKAILTGTPYPQTLLLATVRRVRAERQVTYARAALIKGVLRRESRFRYFQQNKEVDMALDHTNTNIGYRLGRLFAALEKIQEEANPGINATIRDRFYGAASGTPVATFPHLMKLKNHHLARLDHRVRAVNLEKIVGEIIEGIDGFPARLGLTDQGRFAVGYYHQRQDFFKKRDAISIDKERSSCMR